MSSQVKVGERPVKVSNLEKPLWPGAGLKKYDLIYYYISVAPYLLPHLRERFVVLQRFPDGIEQEGFYQKNCPQKAPYWIKTESFRHQDDNATNYIIAGNVETLIWLGNQAAVEIHPWLSGRATPDYPDYAVFDLDPMEKSTFEDVRETALVLHNCLQKLCMRGYPKTSGATGIQVYVPLHPIYTYEEVRRFVMGVCGLVNELLPQKTTMQRKIEKREGKIYLDYLQNVQGKTLVSPYSPRPLPDAPVSMPLSWHEVKKVNFKPRDFNILNAVSRLQERGDLFSSVLTDKQHITSYLP